MRYKIKGLTKIGHTPSIKNIILSIDVILNNITFFLKFFDYIQFFFIQSFNIYPAFLTEGKINQISYFYYFVFLKKIKLNQYFIEKCMRFIYFTIYLQKASEDVRHPTCRKQLFVRLGGGTSERRCE